MLVTFLGNFGLYSFLQYGHFVFCPTYLYYYTENILMKSIIEISEEIDNIRVKLYNGIKDYKTYADSSSYYYGCSSQISRIIC